MMDHSGNGIPEFRGKGVTVSLNTQASRYGVLLLNGSGICRVLYGGTVLGVQPGASGMASYS
jgi:hypothetical protein